MTRTARRRRPEALKEMDKWVVARKRTVGGVRLIGAMYWSTGVEGYLIAQVYEEFLPEGATEEEWSRALASRAWVWTDPQLGITGFDRKDIKQAESMADAITEAREWLDHTARKHR